MGKELLGIKKFTSKKGQYFMILQISKPFNSFETQNGSVGVAVEEVWINEPEVQLQVEALKLHKPIAIDYDVSNGKPYVIGVRNVDK